MKSTLKLSLAAILLGLSATSLLRADDQPVPVPPAPATTPASGEASPLPHVMSAQRRLDKLSAQIDLTDDQKAKILPLLQAQVDQLVALRNDPSLPDEERHAKMRAIGKATSKQIRTLLTPDQLQKFKALHAQGGPPSPADSSPPPNSLPMGGSLPSADGPPPPSN
jgi:protein CpxP